MCVYATRLFCNFDFFFFFGKKDIMLCKLKGGKRFFSRNDAIITVTAAVVLYLFDFFDKYNSQLFIYSRITIAHTNNDSRYRYIDKNKEHNNRELICVHRLFTVLIFDFRPQKEFIYITKFQIMI